MEKVTAVVTNPLYASDRAWEKPLKNSIRGWMNYHAGIATPQSLYGVEFQVVSHLNELTGDNLIAGFAGSLFAQYDKY